MSQENTKFCIFIDTKLDQNQNPSNFKIKLSDGFLRNKIKNSDNRSSDWFISVKTMCMFNSFSNISLDINDEIILYLANTDTADDYEIDQNQYTKFIFKIPQGNPNINQIRSLTNDFLITYHIEIIYNNIDSSFTFRNISGSTNIFKHYFNFNLSFDLYGMDPSTLYELNNNTLTSFKSIKPVNLMADRLLKFSIGQLSDFKLKNSNYCNHMDNFFSNCNLFLLVPINVLPYEIINYERRTENYIPIELHKNNITNFEILTRNQDNTEIEGLGDYIMVLEFINIKKVDYMSRILQLLELIYFWIAKYLMKKI